VSEQNKRVVPTGYPIPIPMYTIHELPAASPPAVYKVVSVGGRAPPEYIELSPLSPPPPPKNNKVNRHKITKPSPAAAAAAAAAATEIQAPDTNNLALSQGVNHTTAKKEVEEVGNEDKDPYKYHTTKDDFLLAGIMIVVVVVDCYCYFILFRTYTNDDCNVFYFYYF